MYENDDENNKMTSNKTTKVVKLTSHNEHYQVFIHNNECNGSLTSVCNIAYEGRVAEKLSMKKQSNLCVGAVDKLRK